LILFASCNREPQDVTIYQEPVINPPIEDVMAGLVGTVTTDGYQPVGDAEVTIGANSTMTDENGKFSFENTTLFGDGTYISVNKPGYLFGARKIYAIESEINVAQIELMPETTGDELIEGLAMMDSENQLEVNFPSGDYLLGANEPFLGLKSVQLTTIPSNSGFNKIPGDLTGVDLGTDLRYKVKALSNFGVFNIRISSQSNDQIQLPENSKATFELKLADADLINLPSVVSLFHFDQTNGTS